MRNLMSAGPGEIGDFDPRDAEGFGDELGFTAEDLKDRHDRREAEIKARRKEGDEAA